MLFLGLVDMFSGVKSLMFLSGFLLHGLIALGAIWFAVGCLRVCCFAVYFSGLVVWWLFAIGWLCLG